MSGMGDGYVGTAQDSVRIRKLEKQREAERRKIQELKDKSSSAKGQPGLLQFGKSRSEVLEHAFKKETVGLVTREEYVEKRINIRTKFEEEEKEKLQKQQQEEEELQLKKRKQRKIKGNSRLSFADDIENGSEEEDGENEPSQSKRLRHGKFGKDPTVETSFLPDRCDEDALSVSGRQRNKLSVKGYRDSGFLSRSRFELFHFDVHEDVRTTADATIEKDESHAGKVVERHWYEKNKHIFPASRWEIYDSTKKWERYTIHGD